MMDSLHSYRRVDPGVGDTYSSPLAKGLGVFSVGLGLAEVIAPRALSRLIGLEPSVGKSLLLRAFGARELAAAAMVLGRPRDSKGLWSRVVGDAIDLGAMAIGFAGSNTKRGRLAIAMAAVAGVTALDIYAAMAADQLAKRVEDAGETAPDDEPLIFSVTINKAPDEVYAAWRRFSDLPKFMTYLESVTETANGKSHWVAKLPVGGTIEWDAEIVEDIAGERIAWRSVEGSKYPLQGEVTFARRPGGIGTEVRVQMKLALPGLGASPTIAKLLTKPQVKGDLRRFKAVMETGELVFSDANSHRGPHPAQPDPEAAKWAREQAAKSHLSSAGDVTPIATSQNGVDTPEAIASETRGQVIIAAPIGGAS